MIDSALSIMALIAGGFILELFAEAGSYFKNQSPAPMEVSAAAEFEEAGNPS